MQELFVDAAVTAASSPQGLEQDALSPHDFADAAVVLAPEHFAAQEPLVDAAVTVALSPQDLAEAASVFEPRHEAAHELFADAAVVFAPEHFAAQEPLAEAAVTAALSPQGFEHEDFAEAAIVSDLSPQLFFAAHDAFSLASSDAAMAPRAQHDFPPSAFSADAVRTALVAASASQFPPTSEHSELPVSMA